MLWLGWAGTAAASEQHIQSRVVHVSRPRKEATCTSWTGRQRKLNAEKRLLPQV